VARDFVMSAPRAAKGEREWDRGRLKLRPKEKRWVKYKAGAKRF
jgi:hypothetical protein